MSSANDDLLKFGGLRLFYAYSYIIYIYLTTVPSCVYNYRDIAPSLLLIMYIYYTEVIAYHITLYIVMAGGSRRII